MARPPAKFIPYGHQTVLPSDAKAVLAALRSEFLTQGPMVEKFEEALCRVTGARYAVAVSSGTAALHLAMLSQGIGTGDSVLTTPITFSATANAAVYVGARPHFIDIDPSTYQMCPERLDEYLRAATRRKYVRAVVPVHFMGTVGEVETYHRIAARHGIPIIEDAAHALGSSYQHGGRTCPIGSCRHASASILSFHPIKTITTGEGGALLTNDRRVFEKARRFRHHGIVRPVSGPGWKYDIPQLGFNYRITDFQCALGLAQLSRLDAIRATRRRLVEAYDAAFRGMNEAVLVSERPGTMTCRHLYVIQVPPGLRNRLYEHLKASGIGAQVNYIPVHLLSYYRSRFGYKTGDFPVSEGFSRRCLSLPLFPGLTEEAQQRVIARVRGFFK